MSGNKVEFLAMGLLFFGVFSLCGFVGGQVPAVIGIAGTIFGLVGCGYFMGRSKPG